MSGRARSGDVSSLQHSASAGSLAHAPGTGSVGLVTSYDPDRGWGLITDKSLDEEQNVWFHVSSWGGKTPGVGIRVTFTVADRPGGKGPEAKNIQVYEASVCLTA